MFIYIHCKFTHLPNIQLPFHDMYCLLSLQLFYTNHIDIRLDFYHYIVGSNSAMYMLVHDKLNIFLANKEQQQKIAFLSTK